MGIEIEQITRSINVTVENRNYTIKRVLKDIQVSKPIREITVANEIRNITSNRQVRDISLNQVTREIQVTQVGRRGPQGIEGPQGPIGLPGADAPGAIVIIYDEVPSGAKDDSNTLFTTARDYQPLSTRVYLNGLRQTQPGDYSEVLPDQIETVLPPSSLDVLTIDYIVN